MKRYKYIVIGAGPSGLTLAHSLIDHGVSQNQILVLEKESTAGGLCRSEIVDDAPLDIGGGHFLDIRNNKVLEFLFRFMPKGEWDTYERISKIRLRGQEIDHPLEANLWQLAKADQVDYLESIAQAGCVRGEPAPVAFANWIVWKLGKRIAEEYMLPYNRKIWSVDPNELGTYWLHKLPDVSFRETLRSCLENRPFGELPAHGTFLYPKRHGYGEVWRRMGEELGDSLATDCKIESIDLSTRTINGCWQAETIVNTAPWSSWLEFCQMPENIQIEIKKLRNVAIDVDYMSDTLSNPAHWIYEPDENIPYHRLLLRSNFCPGSQGYWTETNTVRSKPAAGWRHRNEYAYPVNTVTKPDSIQKILSWTSGQGVVGMGRWGKWEHMNSDVAVAEALAMSEHLVRGTTA